MKTILNSNLSDRQMLSEDRDNWNLQQLYRHLESIKIKKQKEPLTSLEKVCLEGLFHGQSPEIISQALPEEVDYYSVQITFWNLYSYIKEMTGRDEKEISNYQDVIESLDSSGYKPGQANTILVAPESSEGALYPQILNYVGSDSSSIVPQHQQIVPISQSQHEQLVRVDENDFMPAINPWTRLGGMLLAGSVGIMVALSAFTPYKVTVKANATIRPDGKINIVQAETPGTVVAIQAQENQTIKKGDVIAKVDNSSLEMEVNLLQNQIQQTQLQLQQIGAQKSALDRQILAETERINNSVAEAEANLNRTRRDFRDRQITSSAQVEEAQANLNLARVELEQAQAELKSAQANLESQVAAFKSAKSKLNRYQTIAEVGALSGDLLEETKLAYLQQEQAVRSQQAIVERHQSAILRQQQAIAASKARLNNLMAALNPSNAEVAIVQKQIAQTQASGKANLATLNREREALKQQAIETQKQLERYNRQLKQARKNSYQTIIKAPTSGTLFQLNLRNSGQNVQLGTEVAKIAPENSSLIAKAYVKPQDINQISIGQPAQLRISACPYPDFGTLKGEVIQVSPDAIPTQGGTAKDNIPNSQSLYEVTIKPKSLTLSQGAHECGLQLGMEGEADIIAKEETVLKFFLRKARLISDI
ncbi:MAG: HlyD family efflux transporter periplasmic adaptor subunit [Cyanobacteria bacterium P01_G01_bin.19]